MAAPTTVFTVIKRMPYRTNPAEEWSNQYMLTGSTPADAAAWRALFDLLVAQEKTCYPSTSEVIGGYAYDKVPQKGDSAVWSVDLRVAPNAVVPGTLSTGGVLSLPGDDAVWVRWGLDRFTSKGKRIYLRKYFHDVPQGASGRDTLQTPHKTALIAFGAKMSDNSFATGRKLTDSLGTSIVNYGASTYATTRTLKRRGKRPPTSG